VKNSQCSRRIFTVFLSLSAFLLLSSFVCPLCPPLLFTAFVCPCLPYLLFSAFLCFLLLLSAFLCSTSGDAPARGYRRNWRTLAMSFSLSEADRRHRRASPGPTLRAGGDARNPSQTSGSSAARVGASRLWAPACARSTASSPVSFSTPENVSPSYDSPAVVLAVIVGGGSRLARHIAGQQPARQRERAPEIPTWRACASRKNRSAGRWRNILKMICTVLTLGYSIALSASSTFSTLTP